jgi:hypothetical protein
MRFVKKRLNPAFFAYQLIDFHDQAPFMSVPANASSTRLARRPMQEKSVASAHG